MQVQKEPSRTNFSQPTTKKASAALCFSPMQAPHLIHVSPISPIQYIVYATYLRIYLEQRPSIKAHRSRDVVQHFCRSGQRKKVPKTITIKHLKGS